MLTECQLSRNNKITEVKIRADYLCYHYLSLQIADNSAMSPASFNECHGHFNVPVTGRTTHSLLH